MRPTLSRAAWSLPMALALFALLPSVAQGQSRRVVIEAEEILGTVQKPEVQLIISKQNLDQDYDLVLKESFIPKIVQSIETDPF